MYICEALVIFLNKEIFPWMFQGRLSIAKVDSGVSVQKNTVTQVSC